MDSEVSINKKLNKDEELHDEMLDDIEGDSDTPEAEGGVSGADGLAIPVKRKGGRKPIYATSEERKQRNRQAQAAFRERRSEYIKHLEEALQVVETNHSMLAQAHRAAADECLMLRYKNSLLERILLENNIDVQTELTAKTGSPSLGPVHMAPSMVPPPTAHRAIMNRHQQARRSTSHNAPKLETASSHGNPSPQTSRPTPISQQPSPSANSPNYVVPGAENQIPLQRALQPNKSHIPLGLANLPGGMMPQQAPPSIKSPGSGGTTMQSPPAVSPYYAAYQQGPAYGTPSTIGDSNSPQGVPGPYVPPNMSQRHNVPPQSVPQQHHAFDGTPQQQQQLQQHQFGSIANTMMYPFDGAMDADPFGLSASMSFPTNFNFDRDMR